MICNIAAKWLSEEALQISVKRREVKSKREKEIYLFECKFQRIARRGQQPMQRNRGKQ